MILITSAKFSIVFAIGISGDIHDSGAQITYLIGHKLQLSKILSLNPIQLNKGSLKDFFLGQDFVLTMLMIFTRNFLKHLMKSKIFVDDTTCFCFSTDIDSLCVQLQNLTNEINNWALLNGMVNHPEKANTNVRNQDRRSLIRSSKKVMSYLELSLIAN